MGIDSFEQNGPRTKFFHFRGPIYELSVGRIGNLEVDFILRDPSGEYSYLQVAWTIYGEEDANGVDRTQEREYRSLEQIQDNYPKYILSLDYLLQKRSGILHKNIVDLMSKNEGFTGLN